MLNEKEKYRYDRQMKLAFVGETGQEKIKAARVLVIGAGGLGCPALVYMVGSGIGKIGIVDMDTVHESNLPRQILFDKSDIGNNKAFAARDQLKKKNQFIELVAYPQMLDAKLALELFPHYDVIVDATDNFSTRYLINDVCVLLNKPFVFGSVYKTEGQLSVFNYLGGPTYRCLFPNPPLQITSCEEGGVLGSLCGLIGAEQASEVLKIILESGKVRSGKLSLFNLMDNRYQTFEFSRSNQAQPETTQSADALLNFDYALFCGEQETKYTITAEEMRNLIIDQTIQVFDIRQDWEDPKLHYENTVSIPLHEIERAANVLSKDKKIVVVCQYGTRSNLAVDYLRKKHQFTDVVHLQGGVVNFLEG